MTGSGWKELLTLRIEDCENSNLTVPQMREIRRQALDTAKAWSSKDSHDVLALLRVHSSPLATMSVPQIPEQYARRVYCAVS